MIILYTGFSLENFKFLSLTCHYDFQLGCCGHNSSADFISATSWNETAADGSKFTVPAACCKSSNHTAQSGLSEVEQCMKSPTQDTANLKVIYKQQFGVIRGGTV